MADGAAAWVDRPETQRLFADQVPSVPVFTATNHAPQSSAAQSSLPTSSMLGFGSYDESTLDESVWSTLKRDMLTIGRNLRSVLIPVNWDFHKHSAQLHNWDLWGPLIFMLALAITLSAGEKKPSDVFALVFTEVALGAVVLTVNTILLGGNIVFFQSLCLIGYCLFPIDIAAIVCLFVKIGWVRTIVLVAGLGWAAFATVPFIGKTVPQTRRALAVYPVLLMYVSIGWLALVKS
eukprot:jgi/Chrzof1/597/Cz01g21230.t1